MKTFDKIWQSRFDGQVLKEGQDYQKMWYASPQQQEDHKKVVLKILRNRKEGAIILEAGCGTGYYLNVLENMNKAHSVYGLDVSYNMLQAAGKFRNNLPQKLIQGALGKLPFGKGKIDAVISMAVLQTVDDHSSALAELCRVIKPGGQLVLSTLRKYSFWELPFLVPWLFMLDYYRPKNMNIIYNVVRNRDVLVWEELPPGHPPKRYSFADLKKILEDNSMGEIKCYFPGRSRHVPVLCNSLNMIIGAKKK